MNRLYQLDYQCAPWHTFRYTIESGDGCDTSLHHVRRTGFRKYRQFEDENGKILFYIGVATIKSVDNEEILANIQINRKTVETVIGNFTLSNLDISRRSYILKINDNIIAQVTKRWRDRYIIEIRNINEQYRGFIFALLVLINSVLETVQNPISYSNSIHVSDATFKDARSFLLNQ